MEVGSQVKALVTPVGEVAASRTVADSLSIHVQNEAVVGADADDVGGRNGWQIERAAEMENEGLAQGRGWVGDPGGLPFMMGWIGLERWFEQEH